MNLWRACFQLHVNAAYGRHIYQTWGNHDLEYLQSTKIKKKYKSCEKGKYLFGDFSLLIYFFISSLSLPRFKEMNDYVGNSSSKSQWFGTGFV